MPFSFIKESALRHDRDVVEKNLSRYQPLNYNQFRWWRSHTDMIKPLGKRALLKDRILNGDFNESSYFMQAQLALHQAKDKINLNRHNHSDQLEILAVDLARYKRLIDDYNKEDDERLEALYEAFTAHFKINRNELIEELCNWSGDLLSYYEYCVQFKYEIPISVRKSKRGRPRKK
tara:strand:+ start:487 stop:1014 length:528 start_codon:yes stop_codon:yes gene_type:complete